MKMMTDQEIIEFLMKTELTVVIDNHNMIQQFATVTDWYDHTTAIKLRQRTNIFNSVSITPAVEEDILNAVKIGRFINIETRRNGNVSVLQFERKARKWKKNDLSNNKSK